jgi:hypothetical protein
MRSACRTPTVRRLHAIALRHIEKFHAAEIKVLNSAEMQPSLQQLGVEALPMTPGEMDGFVAREPAASFKVIKTSGIK